MTGYPSDDELIVDVDYFNEDYDAETPSDHPKPSWCAPSSFTCNGTFHGHITSSSSPHLSTHTTESFVWEHNHQFDELPPTPMNTDNDFPSMGENVSPSSNKPQTEVASHTPNRIAAKGRIPGAHHSRRGNFVRIKPQQQTIQGRVVKIVAKRLNPAQGQCDTATPSPSSAQKKDVTESTPDKEKKSKESQVNEVLGPNTSVRRMFLERFLPHISSLGSIQIRIPNPSTISGNIDEESLSSFIQKTVTWISTHNPVNWKIGIADIFCSHSEYSPLPDNLKLKPKRAKPLSDAQRKDRESELAEWISDRMQKSYSFKCSSPGEKLLNSLFDILLDNVSLEENADNSFEEICERLFKTSYCPFCGHYSYIHTRGQSGVSSTVKRHLAMGNASQTQYAHFVRDE